MPEPSDYQKKLRTLVQLIWDEVLAEAAQEQLEFDFSAPDDFTGLSKLIDREP